MVGHRESDTSSKSPLDGFSVSPPPLTLPKGGGAIRGIGEKFAANPVTGTGSMTVPIATSPGRSGFGPQLSLSYDSGAGNGRSASAGACRSPPSRARPTRACRDTATPSESDVFILSGAEDLVPVLAQQSERQSARENRTPARRGLHHPCAIRPRIEGLFARIERWTNTTDATAMSTGARSPRTTSPRSTARRPEVRIADPRRSRAIFSWLICESYDDKGNAIVYEYKRRDWRRRRPRAGARAQPRPT